MAETGFPGGITSPSLGSRPISGKVFYCGNRSGLQAGNGADPLHPISTLNGALAKTVSGRGDVIRIVPGSVLTVASADAMTNLKAGTRIEGMAVGNAKPIIRWTVAGSTFLLDVADVSIENCWLQMAGDPSLNVALTVAAPITVSAADCAIRNCEINFGIDADQIVTVGITTTTGAKRFDFSDNICNGNVLAKITAAGTFLRLNGADGTRIKRNFIRGALATNTDGLIESLTTLSDALWVTDNYIEAIGSGNTCAVDFGQALACTGTFENNTFGVTVDATAVTVIFTVNAANTFRMGSNNKSTNDNNQFGIQTFVTSV